MWTRQQLWAAHDAAQLRRAHAGVFAIYAAISLAWTAIVFIGYGAGASRRAPLHESMLQRTECASDGDCSLFREFMTCCGDCPAVPPFEAIPRSTLDELRRAIGERCTATHRCDPPSCSATPAGCEARAVCDRGTCSVIANEQCAMTGTPSGLY